MNAKHLLSIFVLIGNMGLTACSDSESNDIIEAALHYFEKNHFDENTCTWSTVIKENN